MTFADRVIKFYGSLSVEDKLPQGINILNPYTNDVAISACKQFYNKYYNDSEGRILIVGINPGRFGAGITGIPFTDPVVLENECSIKNNFEKRTEISSEFIYKLINATGSISSFYKRFYIGSISPLGFVMNGKNFNYYDSKEMMTTLKPFIVSNLIKQIGLGINSRKCYCLGQGKNYEYLKMLNIELELFDEIIPLPHPRWVMQYRRKQLDNIISDVVGKLIQ